MTRPRERETSPVVLRAARSVLETARAPEGVVTYEDRLDFAQTSVLSLASTSKDPRVLARLLVEVGELAARLAHAVEERAGRSGVEDALAGRPVRWRAPLVDGT